MSLKRRCIGGGCMSKVVSDCKRVELDQRDSAYPASLLELNDAPTRLYVRGDPEALSVPGLAIIGTRRATPYGEATCELAARVAAEAGVSVVSGGAVGCDQAAGLEAVRRGGCHIVVVGCGADVIYPASSEQMVERTVRQGGAVVSLVPWGTQPRRYLFPKRNRIIAALSRAVFIAEAGLPSGTFSTAEAALELGREVLAVPGSIFSPLSRGTNHLISEGACCIADEEAIEVAISRIFGTLRYPHESPKTVTYADATTARALELLVAAPMRSEELARALSLDSRSTLELLGDLIVSGDVEQQIDGRFTASKATLHARTSFGHNKP